MSPCFCASITDFERVNAYRGDYKKTKWRNVVRTVSNCFVSSASLSNVISLDNDTSFPILLKMLDNKCIVIIFAQTVTS